MWSRGGKFAATVAMAVNRNKDQPLQASDPTPGSLHPASSQDGSDPQHSQHRQGQSELQHSQDKPDHAELPEEEAESGQQSQTAPSAADIHKAADSEKQPGSNSVSKHGAGDPQMAAGGQVQIQHCCCLLNDMVSLLSSDLPFLCSTLSSVRAVQTGHRL